MKSSDWIFKMGLLIIGVGFIAVYFLSSQNGRYQYLKGEKSETVFDTHTGIIHLTGGADGKRFGHIDVVNNTFRIDKVKNSFAQWEEPGK